MSDWDLSAYDYELPERLIAQEPAHPRDTSRLLVIDRKKGRWEHRTFKDLPEYFDSRDIFVVNNTRVLKARFLGHRLLDDGAMGGKTEFVLLEELRPRVWEGLFHASVKHRPGVRFIVPTPDGKGLRGTLMRGASGSPHGTVVVEFDRDPIESDAGEVPLPHYIRRESASRDESQYQTLYARHLGSAAAPTAGLHFTDAVMAQLRERNVGWDEITLHVGLGTFRPVKSEDIRQHQMHEERYEISQETAAHLTEVKAVGRLALQPARRIVAVGTTSVRTLESAWKDGVIRPGVGRTSLFITPGFQFHVVDRLLTNFHLPKSTLLILVCAFAGRDLVLEAYRDAVREEYRFFSYGDAMLII